MNDVHTVLLSVATLNFKIILGTFSCSYPCTYVTILHKNPTNAQYIFNVTVLTLSHSYIFPALKEQ
jgi:hypothetical protein